MLHNQQKTEKKMNFVSESKTMFNANKLNKSLRHKSTLLKNRFDKKKEICIDLYIYVVYVIELTSGAQY